MSNILFLDFDGPLYPRRLVQFTRNASDPTVQHFFEYNQKKESRVKIDYVWMDDAAVAMLNKLHAEAKGGIEIVVTSSWRLFLDGRLSVEELFNINGLYVPLHHDWCVDEQYQYDWGRPYEIRRWLDAHDDCNYAILDDPESGYMLDTPTQFGLDPWRCVMVDADVGIELKHYDMLHKIFVEKGLDTGS